MKTSILLCVFVFAFAETVARTPQKEQTNSHKITHLLVELSKKYNLVDQTTMKSLLKSNELPTLESVENQGWKGREVVSLVNDAYPTGNHSLRFDASGLSSGVYNIRLDAPGFQQTSRVTHLK